MVSNVQGTIPSIILLISLMHPVMHPFMRATTWFINLGREVVAGFCVQCLLIGSSVSGEH